MHDIEEVLTQLQRSRAIPDPPRGRSELNMLRTRSTATAQRAHLRSGGTQPLHAPMNMGTGSRRMRATISAGTSGKSMSGVSGLQVEDGVAGERVGDAADGAPFRFARASAACRAHAGAQKGVPPAEAFPKVGTTGVACGAERMVGVCGENWTRRGPEEGVRPRDRAGLGMRGGETTEAGVIVIVGTFSATMGSPRPGRTFGASEGREN